MTTPARKSDNRIRIDMKIVVSGNIFEFKNVIVDTGNPDFLICDFKMLDEVPENIRKTQITNHFSCGNYDLTARIRILDNENGHLIRIGARNPKILPVVRDKLILGLESMKHYNFHLLKDCKGYFDSE